ncbi:hypothetical protein EPI10_029970 [Gossypium australe]|uniref:Uncharacterized protein n=1 Tax=Gossypium australe TaxID=47621 RepID=A0A5B6WZB1_9ROSI|nr:hypothetical protein EPI10_029970 [Gossypium australe]
MDAELGKTLCDEESLSWRSLTKMDGRDLPNPLNSDSIKRKKEKKRKEKGEKGEVKAKTHKGRLETKRVLS